MQIFVGNNVTNLTKLTRLTRINAIENSGNAKYETNVKVNEILFSLKKHIYIYIYIYMYIHIYMFGLLLKIRFINLCKTLNTIENLYVDIGKKKNSLLYYFFFVIFFCNI